MVTEWDLSQDRVAQGWTRPDYSPARLIVAPTPHEREKLAGEYARSDSVHIFSGLRAYPQTYRTLCAVSRTDATVGIFAEPGRDNDGLRAYARRLRYRLQAFRWRNRIDFLLATGSTGVEWFRESGFPPERIYPFAYFVADPSPAALNLATPEPNQPSRNPPVRFLFVGQLVHHKGLHILLKALGQLGTSPPWLLDLVGAGPNMEEYQELTARLGLADRVRWLGTEDNPAVRARMAQADCLILPSLYDGWGAVVNEALLCGTKVVVSDACGASDLIRHGNLGRVFVSKSCSSLTDAIATVLAEGRLSAEQRAEIRMHARATLSAESGAEYLLAILRHCQGEGGRPTPPWRAASV